jgi:hypothetical protein
LSVRRTVVAVAAALAVGSLVLSGCAGNIRVDPSRVSAGAQRLDDLSEIIGGNPHQRFAGEILQYHADQDPIKACMESQGFDYTPPAFVNPYAGLDHIHMGIGVATWFAPLDGTSLGATASAARSARDDRLSPNPGYESLDAGGKATYASALSGCVPANASQVNFPPMSLRLANEYTDVLGTVFKNPEIKSLAKEYRRCIRKAGFATDDYDQLLDGLVKDASAVGPPRNGSAPSPAWQAVVDTERKAAKADVACRREIHDVAVTLVADKVDEFAASHADDLLVVREQWADIEAAAAKFPEYQHH